MFNNKKCYVYAFLDIRKKKKFVFDEFEFNYEPIYVGVSKRKERLEEHIRDAFFRSVKPTHFIYKIRKIKKETGKLPKSVIIKQHLPEKEALEFERYVIQKIGRIDLKTGPLTNKCDGGRGFLNVVISMEQRQKISKALKGRKLSEEHKKLIRESTKGINKDKRRSLFERKRLSIRQKNRILSEKHKKAIRQSTKGINKGRKYSEEYCEKMKEFRKKIWIIIKHNKLQLIVGLKEWCKENGIVYSTFRKYQDIRKTCKGFGLISFDVRNF